jgi:hypothetical protein
LTQTNKLCILRHVVEYLEHVPWKVPLTLTPLLRASFTLRRASAVTP